MKRSKVVSEFSFGIDRKPGSGSKNTEDEYADKMGISDNDGRSVTRTTMDYNWLSDNDNGKWTKLKKVNDGMFCKDRKQNNRRANMIKDMNLFFDCLSLNEQEKKRGAYIFNNIDFGTFIRGIEPIILAIAYLVTDENCKDIDNRLSKQDEFQELLDINDVTMKDIRKCRKKIRREYDFF